MRRYNATRIPSFDRDGRYLGTLETPCESFADAYRQADNYRRALSEALGGDIGRVSVQYNGDDRIVEVSIV